MLATWASDSYRYFFTVGLFISWIHSLVDRTRINIINHPFGKFQRSKIYPYRSFTNITVSAGIILVIFAHSMQLYITLR